MKNSRYHTLCLSVAMILSVLCFPVMAVSQRPVVVIVATGGTIAGKGATTTTTVGYKPGVVGVESLIDAVPEIKTLADVRGEQIFQTGSAKITPAHWLTLARRIDVILKDPVVAGVVVTHGTDTLEETAYFLHLTVRSSKPVVVTGSMRPSTAISADGPANLYDAVAVAASPSSRGRGVLVVLNNEINGAREVTKTNTFMANTFRSPDLGLLGYVQAGKPSFYRATTRKHTGASEFDLAKVTDLPSIEIIYGYGGTGRVLIDGAVGANVRGIVYAGAGQGSLSLDAKAALADARTKGIAVVRSSRTGSGIVPRDKGEGDDDHGFVAGDNLTAQKARILLMLALTVTPDPVRIQEIFWSY